jgi:pimeloyl-ACP methyl ester carboxylesterase
MARILGSVAVAIALTVAGRSTGSTAPLVPWPEDDHPELCRRLIVESGEEPRRLRLGSRVLRFWEHGPTAPIHTPATEPADDPILFVHGYLGDLCDFGPLLLAMAERHRVVAFDLPGFGESTSEDAIASIETYVHLIAEMVARLKLERVNLVCHSMGAQVCIGVGLTSPSFVRSMTLIDAAGVYEPATFVGRLSKRMARLNVGEMLAEKGRTALDLFDGNHVISRRLVSQNPAKWAALSSFQSDFRSEVGKLALPVLVIWGHDDPIFSLDSACLLKESIRGAVLYVIDGAGHAPQLSHPTQTLAHIEPFLSALGEAPHR